MKFEWDLDKDRSNVSKHRLSFTEAMTVFGDPLHQTLADPRHSFGEFRFVTTGYTSAGRLVVVAHSQRGERVRIITARFALPKERRFHESEN
jgi:uncharacterized protein